MQIHLINGKNNNNISIFERSFNFGDGIFETTKVVNGSILYIDYHLKRLQEGIKKLDINLNYKLLIQEIKYALTLITKDCALKIIISRGNYEFGGYSYNKKISANRIIISYKLKQQNNYINLNFCHNIYGDNENLAGIKHQNRLEQIIARADKNDCIMLDIRKNIISTTTANIFIIKDKQISTPKIDKCGIKGTRRALIIDNYTVIIKDIGREELLTADEVFITNALIGIISVSTIIKYKFNYSETNIIRQHLIC